MFAYIVREHVARASQAANVASNEAPVISDLLHVLGTRSRAHTRSVTQARRNVPILSRFKHSDVPLTPINQIENTDYSFWRRLEEHVQKQLRNSYALSEADAGSVTISKIHILQQMTKDNDYPVPRLKPGTYVGWVRPHLDQEKY